jgi:hypothetical protein
MKKTDLLTGLGLSMLLLGLLWLSGCGGKYSYTPIEGSPEKGEPYHYKVLHDLSITHFFSGIPQVVEYLHCTVKLAHPLTEEEREFPFRGCVAISKEQYAANVSPGAANFTGQVIHGAAIGTGIGVGGYFMGRGLGRSGDTVNQNSSGNGNADADSTSSNATNSNNRNTTTNVNPRSTTNINSGNTRR